MDVDAAAVGAGLEPIRVCLLSLPSVVTAAGTHSAWVMNRSVGRTSGGGYFVGCPMKIRG
jgi:hypothetical protein